MKPIPPPPTRLLMQILDGSDAAQRAAALMDWACSPRRLLQMTSDQLVRSGLLTRREATRLRSAFQFLIHALNAPLPSCLEQPRDVADHMAWLSLESDEALWTVNVGPALRPISVQQIAKGGPAKCWAEVSDILRPTLSVGATGLFMVHNHPTGDPTPSQQDLDFTKRVQARAQWFGIALHDHLVLAGSGWTSCKTGVKGRLSRLSAAPPMESLRNAWGH